jgi:hypothetical protein
MAKTEHSGEWRPSAYSALDGGCERASWNKLQPTVRFMGRTVLDMSHVLQTQRSFLSRNIVNFIPRSFDAQRSTYPAPARAGMLDKDGNTALLTMIGRFDYFRPL